MKNRNVPAKEVGGDAVLITNVRVLRIASFGRILVMCYLLFLSVGCRELPLSPRILQGNSRIAMIDELR